jgi:hypothetical protein
LKRILLLWLATAAALSAQTISPVVPTAPAVYPSYFIATGGGYTRNATPNAAEGWVSAALGLGAGNYSVTTVDMTSTSNTIRTGFAKVFSQSGNFILLGRVDAGVSTVTPVIGSFSGGALLLYNLKGISPRLADLFVLGEVRISGVTATTPAIPNAVTPGFYFGFGKSF